MVPVGNRLIGAPLRRDCAQRGVQSQSANAACPRWFCALFPSNPASRAPRQMFLSTLKSGRITPELTAGAGLRAVQDSVRKLRPPLITLIKKSAVDWLPDKLCGRFGKNKC